MQGKGDNRRPSEVSLEKFDSNWDNIFGQRKKTEYFKARYYTCKSCKKSVTITPKDEYICDSCNKPLLSSSKKSGYYLGFNPMARTTKMEFSDSDFNSTVDRFRKIKHG